MANINDLFQSLAVNEALVTCTGRPGPFRAEIAKSPLPATCDEAKREERARKFQASCHIDPGPPWNEVYQEILQQSASSTVPPNAAAMHLLKKAIEHCHSPQPLKQLAQEAGLGEPTASRISKQLQHAGYITRIDTSLGRQRMVFLDPTPAGFQFLGKTPPAGIGRGAAAHRYCVALVEKHWQNNGFHTAREREIQGKRIDLVATHQKSGGIIFVEVEMSDQNASRNAVANLSVAGTEVSRILVVCPTKTVLKTVQKAVKLAVTSQQIRRFEFKTVSEL